MCCTPNKKFKIKYNIHRRITYIPCYKPLNFKTMTIKELKEKIMFLDENMKVGGSGHFGEFLGCLDAEVRTVTKSRMNDEKEVIFSISIEDAGDEPD